MCRITYNEPNSENTAFAWGIADLLSCPSLSITTNLLEPRNKQGLGISCKYDIPDIEIAYSNRQITDLQHTLSEQAQIGPECQDVVPSGALSTFLP